MLINESTYKNEDTKQEVETLIESAYDGATSKEFKELDLPLDEMKKWLTSDSKAGAIKEDNLEATMQMASLQEKYINETNFSANVSPFVPKLQMLLRRITSNLFAFDVCGVQPVPTPDTSIYMLRGQYSGTTGTPIDRTTSRILIMKAGDVAQAVAVGNTLTSANGAVGTVRYVENGVDESDSAVVTKVIVEQTTGAFIKGELVDVGASYSAGDNDLTVQDVYSNEAGFKQILSGYSGSYTTANGEALGAEMRQIRVNIVRQQITVKTRKLKAELTLELIQDMRSQHNAQADKELMYFLEKEITDDINIEIIEAYKASATMLPNFSVNDTTNENARNDSDKYIGLFNRILKDKRDLSGRNQRGSANIIVATAGVITAMEALGKFMDVKMMGGVASAENYAKPYVGTLYDGTKVYQDFFTEVASGNEYYQVIYKGAGNYDAGVIFSPYSMLQPLEATNYITLQPVIGLQSRFAITVNSLYDTGITGASDYSSIRFVDFAGTRLQD